jgi:anthranilate phosphoribosyltransferase
MDEISPLGSTTVLELVDGEARSWTIEPERIGALVENADDLVGQEPSENARIIEAVLGGRGTAGATAAVVLNAAGALYVAGRAADFGSAMSLAREALKGGAGLDALERLRRASRRSERRS